MKIEDFPDEYQQQIRRKIGVPTRPAVCRSHLEQPVGPGPLAEGKGAALDSLGRVRLRCTTRCHRLGDCDGRSYKHIIDGLVLAGRLKDDSPEYVESVEMRQEKIPRTQPEETVVELYEVNLCDVE
jgi:hypothetical protein